MPFDCRILFNVDTLPGEDQEFAMMYLIPGAQILTSKERLDYRIARWVFINEMCFGLSINYKGFVEPSLDSPANLLTNNSTE